MTSRLELAEVIDPQLIQESKVVFGATVTIINEEEQCMTYQIVGEDEIDVKLGKISWKSPMAKALLGKKVGDEVKIEKPQSEEYATIETLQYK